MVNESDKLQTTEKQEVDSSVERTRPGATFTPAVDIFEDAGVITLVADLPGVRAEDLDIDLRDGLLTLQGGVETLEDPTEIEVHREFESGTYYRQFRLSDSVDQERIDAKLVDGVLTLKLPKVEAARPRQIAVQEG